MVTQVEAPLVLNRALVFFAIVLFLAGCSAKPRPAASAQVYPKDATDLEPVELSKLIYEAMPAKSADGFSWSTLMDGPVRWMTDGIDADPRGHSLRKGLARVKVGGEIVQVLKRRWTEQAWTVRLVGDSNENLGPSRVLMTPSADYVCEYASYQGCTFKASDALRGSDLHVRSVCSGPSPDPAMTFEVFSVEAAGKRQVYAEIVSAGRSDYGGSWLQLTEDNPGCPLDPDQQQDVDQPVSSAQQGSATPMVGSSAASEGDVATIVDHAADGQEAR